MLYCLDGDLMDPTKTAGPQVYRTADMALQCVLPSAADEVNAAVFNPIQVRAAIGADYCTEALRRHV